ncbi:Putative Actin family, ATPase, nucleotide binding domain-containing protein [Septoria linicola]|uniref:Actin family, ATPase, nucleotide binding domain-containing protein n=1 Tax=Septoria linicola TaxID=215465 RepID=A0A9Q9ASJ2_9PEZI|nr:Putative Actin family, ATPase, nucleotide binding domain-containing protein [Septoria linicola]
MVGRKVLDGLRKGKKDLYALNVQYCKSDFLKRDDQILALRLQQEERLDRRKRAAVDLDRARAQNGQESAYSADVNDDDLDNDVGLVDELGENYGSKTVVIHVGSQNMRIGLATDALPKTVPMVIARKAPSTESNDSEPVPKRIKLDDDTPSEEWFGEEFAKEYDGMATAFKAYRRMNKRRVLPNSRELVTKWNSTTPPDIISEHNDPVQLDWTELPTNPAQAPDYIIGAPALRIPEKSKPRYRLSWPVRQGYLNERNYTSRSKLQRDFFLIIEESIKTQLELPHKRDWNQYSCVFIIPDLYEKVFVTTILQELMTDFGFARVCFMQESLAATFGAGFSTACMIDMGAQKTTVCCVEDGMCIEPSRVNLKYGGYDVTETFVKMMLYDKFNYSDFNLMRRHDFLLAEELKEKYTTMSDENISVQLYDFHLRAHGQPTRKYQFKLYDEGVLAPMGFFRPTIFDNAEKLSGRRTLIPASSDLYDQKLNDPDSEAQKDVRRYASTNYPSAVVPAPSEPARLIGTPIAAPTPQKQRPLGIPSYLNGDNDGTPKSSVAGSPPPEGTPMPADDGDITMGDGLNDGTTAPADDESKERVVPIIPIDEAILRSIEYASLLPNGQMDERRRRDFLGSIMLIGGASKTPGLQAYLEQQLRNRMPQYPKEILVAPPPRELDPAVIVWKGASVFGKLRMTNDSWISPLEYDRLGARILNYKCMWHW